MEISQPNSNGDRFQSLLSHFLSEEACPHGYGATENQHPYSAGISALLCSCVLSPCLLNPLVSDLKRRRLEALRETVLMAKGGGWPAQEPVASYRVKTHLSNSREWRAGVSSGCFCFVKTRPGLLSVCSQRVSFASFQSLKNKSPVG